MKTVLITGGTRGIGLSTAIKFKQKNWAVYITSRNQENLDSVLTDHPGLKGFVAHADDLEAASDQCMRRHDATVSLEVRHVNRGNHHCGGSSREVES